MITFVVFWFKQFFSELRNTYFLSQVRPFKMSKSFSRQSKELISILIGYFEAERDNGGPLIPLTAVRERVAQALKINVSTVNSVSTILKSGGHLESPKKKKDRRKPVRDIDDFDQVAV